MWSEECREHPNNKKLPGVCSSCLRDRLSQLDLHPGHKPISWNPSLISDSPASSSYASLPAAHRRNASDVMDSASSMLSFDYGLNKSRSIAFASRNGMSGKDGFWSKLLKLTRKGTKNVSMHSRTFREGRG